MTKSDTYDYLTNTDNDITKDELIHYMFDAFSSEQLAKLVKLIKDEKGADEDQEIESIDED